MTTVDGLQELPSLKKLHLRKNAIVSLEEDKLPDLPSLEYLNIRENELADTSCLQTLKKYPSLQKLGAQDCPLNPEPSGDVRKEILMVLPDIPVLSKEAVTEEEKEEIVQETAERARIAEEARIEAEEEAARLAKEEEEARLEAEAEEARLAKEAEEAEAKDD